MIYYLPVFSRYLVIALAAGVAAWRANDHAWVESIGLSALAVGLVCLRIADLKNAPALRRVAWLCFGVTVMAMGIVFQRDFLR